MFPLHSVQLFPRPVTQWYCLYPCLCPRCSKCLIKTSCMNNWLFIVNYSAIWSLANFLEVYRTLNEIFFKEADVLCGCTTLLLQQTFVLLSESVLEPHRKLTWQYYSPICFFLNKVFSEKILCYLSHWNWYLWIKIVSKSLSSKYENLPSLKILKGISPNTFKIGSGHEVSLCSFTVILWWRLYSNNLSV